MFENLINISGLSYERLGTLLKLSEADSLSSGAELQGRMQLQVWAKRSGRHNPPFVWREGTP
jgi:hypothetical protein